MSEFLGIFETVFGQSGLNFQDRFRIVLLEFFGLFLDSPG